MIGCLKVRKIHLSADANPFVFIHILIDHCKCQPVLSHFSSSSPGCQDSVAYVSGSSPRGVAHPRGAQASWLTKTYSSTDQTHAQFVHSQCERPPGSSNHETLEPFTHGFHTPFNYTGQYNAVQI